MLLVLKKDAKISSEEYSDLAQTVLGEGARLKALCPEVTIQCKGLDEFTTEEELKGALSNQCNGGEDIVLRHLHMRWVPSGTKIATFSLTENTANKVLEVGKVKVNWSVCPLSVAVRPEACFKCLGFGHKAWSCKGPDRRNLCRRCGGEGHKAKGCKAKPKCLICPEGEGNKHVTGSFACQSFKSARGKKGQWK